jgi:ribosomal protein L37AE/L43A
MGISIIPKCKCKYDFQPIWIGRGSDNSDDIFKVPFSCTNCKTIFDLNIILFKKWNCPDCRKMVDPYGEFDFNESNNDIIYKSSFSNNTKKYQLVDRKYKCPNCEEIELTFTKRGKWSME